MIIQTRTFMALQRCAFWALFRSNGEYRKEQISRLRELRDDLKTFRDTLLIFKK